MASGDRLDRPTGPSTLPDTSGGFLRGRAFLHTREERTGSLVGWLESGGACVRHLPLTCTLPPEDPAPLRQAVARLSDFDWVALTSARAVRAVADAIADVRGLMAESDTAGPRWACVGGATAAALRLTLGAEADLLPEDFNAAALAEAMLARGRPRRVLFPAAQIARPDLAERLRAAGVEVVQVAAYRSLPKVPARASLQPPDGRERWDAVLLASGLAARSLIEAFGRDGATEARRWLRENPPAVLGATAAAVLEGAGVFVAIRAAAPTEESLAEAILGAFGR
jgi:uroporphyrinogen-III synthase